MISSLTVSALRTKQHGNRSLAVTDPLWAHRLPGQLPPGQLHLLSGDRYTFGSCTSSPIFTQSFLLEKQRPLLLLAIIFSIIPLIKDSTWVKHSGFTLIKNLNQIEVFYHASLIAQLVKNPLAMQEIPVQSLGWEDPLEKGKPTHSSILAWRIPCTV